MGRNGIEVEQFFGPTNAATNQFLDRALAAGAVPVAFGNGVAFGQNERRVVQDASSMLLRVYLNAKRYVIYESSYGDDLVLEVVPDLVFASH